MRAEKIADARRLRREGHTWAAVGEALGLTRSMARYYGTQSASDSRSRACPGCGCDLSDDHGKRKWCSERCRKATLYGGVCASCGGRTDGSNGRENAPSHCAECAPAAHAKWSAERIIEKIREWAEHYGRPPGLQDWSPTHIRRDPGISDALKQRKIARFESGEWPWAQTVIYHLGSWPEALHVAGFESNPSGSAGHWERAA